jgi:Icc-related predicted phosphoesterase
MADERTYWIGFGDIHEDLGTLGRIPGLAGAAGIIVSGDMTNRGRAPQARQVIEAVRALNPVIYAQIGNMDYAEAGDYLDGEGMNIHGRGIVLAPGVGMLGVGGSTPTPFATPSEFPEEQLAQWLDAAHAEVRDCASLLLVAHNPPLDTTTDRMGSGQHVGSRAVRAFIERVQPDVCLTGHIHEARAVDAIGRTQIVNPGALSRGGYAVITLDHGRLTAELKTV